MYNLVCCAPSPRRLGSTAFLAAALSVTLALPARSEVVVFYTSEGNFALRLYDTATPLTVANFMQYVNTNRYDGTFIHRYVPGFVSQGGGYTNTQQAGIVPIAQFGPVNNEPGISNLTGTIAMAKIAPEDGGGPNSATDQWFFNLANNSANLDFQNGGFTVFGRVLGSGMTVVNKIQSYVTDPGSGFPLKNGSQLFYFYDIAPLNVPVGDYDGSGTTTTSDYAIWRETFGSKTLAEADGNGNGSVDLADYVTWRKSPATVSAAELSGVSAPEPSAFSMLIAASLSLLLRRPRRPLRSIT